MKYKNITIKNVFVNGQHLNEVQMSIDVHGMERQEFFYKGYQKTNPAGDFPPPPVSPKYATPRRAL
jgi:hypothetical protein